MKNFTINFFIAMITMTFYCSRLWACNDDELHEYFTNLSKKDLLLSVYMHPNINTIDSSEILQPGQTKNFDLCAGNGSNPSYDLGISVGPYNFIASRGSAIDWEAGLKYYSKYIISTKNWNKVNWTIYSYNKKNFSAIEYLWNDNKCNEYPDNQPYLDSFNLCSAYNLEEKFNPAAARKTIRTWAHFYIGNKNILPINAPLGAY